MICRSCLRAAAQRRITNAPLYRSARPLSTTAPYHDATASSTSNASSASRNPPPATSTSAAQPFSAPLTPAAKNDTTVATPKKSTLMRSSISAGTPLKGLNFLKDRTDPIAMADDEYPAWLWTILDKQEQKGEAAVAGDLFSKSKKTRRLAAKRLRKEQEANPELLVPKVPVHEQTIDLPSGDGTLEGAVKASDARAALTKAMRNQRRAAIKEKNFLKTMR